MSGATPARRESAEVGDGDSVGDVLVTLARFGWWVVSSVVGFVWRWPLRAAALGVLGWLLFGSASTTAPLVAAAVLVTVGVLLLAWRLLAPASYERVVGRRVRARRLKRWYRRSWAGVLGAHGLTVTRGQDAVLVPKLLRLRCDPTGDTLLVRLAPGQTPGSFAAAGEALAHAFGATSCRVTPPGPGLVLLQLRTSDPLAAVVPALPPGREANLAALPVGRREDGSPWLLRLLGAHVLIAGVPGAGKGSVLWSLLRAVGPDLASGRVVAWAVDLKGGMELALGAPLFARLVDTTPEDAADLLEDAVRVMDARAHALRGSTRLHEPTVEEPLLLLVLDDLASLVAYVPDRAVKARLATYLALLQSKGRAVGVLVVGAVQDPRKETVPLRDLFTVRVALRLPDRELVDMVLGPGASARGAACDAIPLTSPGVGYVLVDGDSEPVRVRAGYVPDDELRAMATRYAAPEASALVVPPRPEPVDEDPPPKASRPRRRAATAAAGGEEA